jgi:hypothetical protein
MSTIGSTILRADIVNLLVPDTDRDGVLEMYSGTVYVNTNNVGEIGYVGKPSGPGYADDYNAVYKFQMDSSLEGKSITSATLHIYSNYVAIDPSVNPNGVEVLLQHYTSENGVTLEANDYTKDKTDVGSNLIASTGWIDWDVTNLVQADLNARFGYTSFFIAPLANPSPTTKHCVKLAELSYVPQWQSYISVEYVPEPATLVLMSLAGLVFRKRIA